MKHFMADVKRIEVHCDGAIQWPPTPSFPLGVKLLPGLNTVPQLYLDEWLSVTVDTEPVFVNGKKQVRQRCPGAEALEALQKPTTIRSVDGDRWGPRITIYEPDQVADRDDGPPLPASLVGLNPTIAKTLIERTRDKQALKRWAADRDHRMAELVTAAKARLAQLGG